MPQSKSLNISHRWHIEWQTDLDDWIRAGYDSGHPISQGEFDHWVSVSPLRTRGGRFRIIHEVTTTTVERTRVEPGVQEVAR